MTTEEKIEEWCKNHEFTLKAGCLLISTAVGVIFKVKAPKINLNMSIKDIPINK